MRLYRHVKAEYTCTACKRGRTLIESRISPLDLIVAAGAGLPIMIVVLRHHEYFSWWYCILAVMAGELLAFFVAGFITGIITAFELRGTHRCRACGGTMFFGGRHFDPAGDADAHYTDLLVLGLFVILNVIFWIAYARGGLAM